MAHAVSASYLRSDHMSPQALALAFLLHALTALALWWMSMHRPAPPTDSTIDVTIEQAKPPEPTPPPPPPAPPTPPTPPTPPAQATPPQPPAPAMQLGLPPPAPPSTEPPKQQPSTQESLDAAPPKAGPQQALTPQPPAQPPPPAIDKSVPPPAPPTTLDYPKSTFPPPAPQPPAAKPPQPAHPPPQQAIRPSPLSPGHHEGTSPEPHAAPSPFQNPAEAASRTRALDAYFWQVVRKFSQYLPDLREKNEGGTVVIRLVIGRDGRLIEAGIARSSGVMALDRGMLEAIRHAAPYPPLPPEVPGDSVVFTQPITAKR